MRKIIVQEAYQRWHSADWRATNSPKAWLVTITTLFAKYVQLNGDSAAHKIINNAARRSY